MKQFSKNFLLTALLMAPLVPASVVAQDSYTVTSLGDLGAWDDPDTPADESIDGVCDDGTGLCSLRAALEEAANRETSVIIHFAVSGTISSGGVYYIPDGSEITGPEGLTITISGNGFSGGDNITITNLIILGGAVGISVGNTNIISNNIINMSGEGIGAGDNNTFLGNQILCGQVGISVVNTNIIGGAIAQDLNVIGGCILGVSLGGSDNRLFGNYIGVDAGGNAALPNQIGIIMANSRNM